jgi:hypothetical protein
VNNEDTDGYRQKLGGGGHAKPPARYGNVEHEFNQDVSSARLPGWS